MATAKPAEVRLKKNAPVHSRGINELYVDTTQPFNQQVERAWRILDEGKLDHVLVHGIGPAIQRVINLALQIKLRGNGMFDVSATTHTVHLHDDLTPIKDGESGLVTSQTRKNSSISIKIFRTLNVSS